MALELEITEEQFTVLPEAIQAEYKETDGIYKLDADIPDVSGLKSQVSKLLGEKKSIQQKAREAEEKIKSAEFKKAQDSGDLETLNKSWETKFDTEKKGWEQKVKQYRNTIRQSTLNSTVDQLAAELAAKPEYVHTIRPHIKERVSVEFNEDEGADSFSTLVRVLDKDGKASAANIKDLKEELRQSTHLAPLIAATKAKGPGLPNNTREPSDEKIYRDTMSEKQKTEYITQNGRDAYLKLPKSK